MAIYGFDEAKNKVDLEKELKVKVFQFVRTPEDDPWNMTLNIPGFTDTSCVLGISYADSIGVGVPTTVYRSGVDAAGEPLGVMEIVYQDLPAEFGDDNAIITFAGGVDQNRLYRIFWI